MLLSEATSSAMVAITSFPASCLACNPYGSRVQQLINRIIKNNQNVFFPSSSAEHGLTNLMTRQNPTFAG
jgi:hypothetical protein